MTAAVVLFALIAGGDDRLALSDLPAYQAALEDRATGAAPSATFTDLWEHPDRHRGRRVRLEGRAVRRFRQGGVGQLPALTELWLTTPGGNPIVLVYPTRVGSEELPRLGASVRFDGTFLKTVRYSGSDVERLAPLVVGPVVPEAIEAASSSQADGTTWTAGQWTLGIVLAGIVLIALILQRLRQPPKRPVPSLGPPVEFHDGVTEGLSDPGSEAS